MARQMAEGVERGDVQDPRCLLRSREDFQKPVIAVAVVGSRRRSSRGGLI